MKTNILLMMLALMSPAFGREVIDPISQVVYELPDSAPFRASQVNGPEGPRYAVVCALADKRAVVTLGSALTNAALLDKSNGEVFKKIKESMRSSNVFTRETVCVIAGKSYFVIEFHETTGDKTFYCTMYSMNGPRHTTAICFTTQFPQDHLRMHWKEFVSKIRYP